MSVTPKEILSLASDLQLAAVSEVEARNSIGRAYYGAYHLALQYSESLPRLGAVPPQELGTHAKLVFQLSNPGLPNSDPVFSKSGLSLERSENRGAK